MNDRRGSAVTLGDVIKLFAWLRSQYGARWTLEGTEEEIESWREALQAYDTADLRRACKVLVAEASEWPPSAGKFARLCKGSIYDQRKRAERWAPPLPPPAKDVARNSQRVAELRERMRMPRSEQCERELERRSAVEPRQVIGETA